MKKIIAMFLSVVMMCSLIPTVFAVEEASEAESKGYIFEPEPNLTHEEIVEMLKNDPNTETSSEYDAILKEKAEAKKVLASKNATASEKIGAKLIEEFDPTAEVYRMQEKTDEELQKMGMSDARIQIIRNFKGTDAELQALSANCSVSGNPKYTKNASGCWSKVTFAFSWSDIPIWQSTDALVARSSTSYYTRVPDVKCNINYLTGTGSGQRIINKEYDASYLKNNPWSDGNIAGFPFAVRITGVSGVYEGTFYALSGMATIVFLSSNPDVRLSYAYAQRKLNFDGSLGISFSTAGASGVLDFGLKGMDYSLLPNGGRAFDPYHFR